MGGLKRVITETMMKFLSVIVFKIFDLVDSILCIIYWYLDEFLEGTSSHYPSCYCHLHHHHHHHNNNNNNNNNNKNESGMSSSETLFGFGRPNYFRNYAVWFINNKSSSTNTNNNNNNKSLQQIRLKKKAGNNKWSDCGCDSCVSWIDDNAANDDLRLHVVVRQPPGGDMEASKKKKKEEENVIFMHGFISSSSFWTETVFNNMSEHTKADEYRLFGVDLLGFGKSPKPTDCQYTLKDHVEMIEKSIIFPFKLNSFHLVAHSMGSIIALALAAKYPNHVKSITLVAPPYFPSSSKEEAGLITLEKVAGKRLWPPIVFGSAVMSWYEHLGRTVCFLFCRNHRIWEFLLKLLTWRRDIHFMVNDLTRHTHHSAWHTMHNVICGGAKLMDDYLRVLSNNTSVKFTIIQGDEDQVVPLECCYNIKIKVPTVDVRIVPNTNHTSVVLAQPKDFTIKLVDIWLSCE